MPDKPDLNALIGSRICHDLISPIGAIGNGLELLQMGGIANSPELALIAQSVENANARIKFFRVAFGASSVEQRLGKAEILSIIETTTKGTRLAINWDVQGDMARREVKLVFLIIQCLESAMPLGGKIAVAKAGTKWAVTGNSTRLRREQEVWDILADTGSDFDIAASQVQFALAALEAERQGRKIGVVANDTEIAVSF